MAGKRKRGDTFSAHEKLAHKSCSLLQREAKKVRAFLVRKAVQQLKQLRQQLQEPAQDETKRLQREQKLSLSVQRFEREHAALKTLDLQKLVARARLLTGLDKPQTEIVAQDEQQWAEQDSDDDSDDDSEEEQDVEQDAEQHETGQNQDQVQEQDEHQPDGEKAKDKEQDVTQDRKLEEKLMDRVLAHKQIVPLLDAIKKLVEKEEKEAEKKRRAQEKRALKRGRHESLVGNTGRSGVAPSSVFIGSLSGRGALDADLDMGMEGYGTMAGADDDIAEFLGEKKKSKNRPGQMARRMKAIRKEEAFKRKEDRANGIFVPYKDNSASVSKYGPSERPKKAKPKAKPGKQGDKQHSRSGNSRADSKEAAPQKEQRAAPAPAAQVEVAHPSWLAKQKQKEKEKVSLTAFSGKKITFD
ncbi:hypothetical protein KRP22_012308 [Phytophthora ramorum]|nr:hypothetical protein KRP22_15012 [Phytophthora ramorum]